jgi:HEAT repeat protein
MKTKNAWLQDIFNTDQSSARRGYEILRTICAQDPTLGQQIVETLIQQSEPYYQILGLYGIGLLASPKWEPLVLKLTNHPNPEVKNTALRALGFVGTESSIASLLASARQEYDGALWALKKLLIKFPDFVSQIFDLAKNLLTSDNARLREQATEIIVKLDKVREAEAALLKSAEIFADEFTLDALKEASAAILPRLERLKVRFTPEGAEYQDIERAINAIAEKQRTLSPICID